MSVVEVWAEITCPFAHVGLRRLADFRDASGGLDVQARAWPLEWVDEPLSADHVRSAVESLAEQLDLSLFQGEPWDCWPETTVPAHALVAAANQQDHAAGFDLALELRTMLFEEGLDISDPSVLADVAARRGLSVPDGDAAVRADHEAGQQREVRGSPHFFVGGEGFFCPSLDLSRDDDDNLVARVDGEGLARFLGWIDRTSS